MKNILSLSFIIYCLVFSATAQQDQSAAGILHELKKLQNPTRVLYLAAHPDDENTRMISWLVNETGANTAYLSLTRGDGGQNLIGSELGAKLGVLRTQELMQAREIDGGQQFFSRAVDFGYSKSAKETLEKWGEDAVLSDVVWVIRKFRPDVIITRFPPDERGRHGHHTASALLGLKAFDMAADEKFFPDQLQYVDPWQPKRMYWNTSAWWDKELPERAKDNPDYLIVDIGGYNALTGVSNNELASLSRTQHKSQGFGVSVSRGSETEYLEYMRGEKAGDNLFEGLAQGWERYNFPEGDKALKDIIEKFEPTAPYKSVDAILELRGKASQIRDKEQAGYFRGQLNKISLLALGWHAEVLADGEFLQSGEKADLKLRALNRSPLEVQLTGLKVNDQNMEQLADLRKNEYYEHEFVFEVNGPVSQPYWLEQPYENLFQVTDQQLIGKPENDPAITALLSLQVNGREINAEVPVTYKFSDRVEGEIVRPVFITPPVVVNAQKQNMIFVGNQGRDLSLEFQFFDKEKQQVKIEAPGWKMEPQEFEIVPAENSNTVTHTVRVTPQEGSENRNMKISFSKLDNPRSLTEINYGHIDKRLVFEPAYVPLINLDLQTEGKTVGYIPGAGDEVDKAISQMGYKVVTLNEEMIRKSDLSDYDAIVAGIRAYNTEDWLPGVKNKLMDYVENGGNYIVQYNTASRDLLSMDLGPQPFEITRDRVTEEDAKVTFLLPGHPVLNRPNTLSHKDFEGWVQERGLYFAGNWHEAYQAPLGWHDEGDETQEGALIIADHGKGAFIYTGISFFRELPAGVPGAYRLLANLISYQKSTKDEQ